MTERISSGMQRLDTILGGGLPRNAINLLIGVPGSGKTILAQQCAYANATEDRPALYFSTVSEPLEKMLRFGQSLSFFDVSAVGKRVIYEDLGSVLGDGGLDGVLDRIRTCIRERQPSMIVIDSFKGLRSYGGEGEYRRFLHELTGIASAFPVTSLWIGEYEPTDIAVAPEFAVADAILALGSTPEGVRSTRTLEVLKLRGGNHLSGKHAYRISRDGVAAFPRLADPSIDEPYVLGEHRRSSGVRALDDMLADGYWANTSTLVVGPTGAGKTLMGLHFIFGGADQGERGVIATLQENPSQLDRICRSFGWSLDNDNVTLMYRSPVDVYIDQWVYELLDTVESVGATRVMVDSLADLRSSSVDDQRFREYVYSLLHRCSRTGVSVMLSHEIPELYGTTTLTEFGASHLADNVVLVQYNMRDDGAIGRSLTVLKTRASSHDPRVREFSITSQGITLDGGAAVEPETAVEPEAAVGGENQLSRG